MNERIRFFNDEEMKRLLKNSNIVGIKNKSQIIYSNKFKYWAIIQKIKFPEKTAREIFEDAGFDMDILNERTPQRRLNYWMKRYLKFGKEYFLHTNKYRYKAINNNFYCEIENSFNLKDLIVSIEKNNLLLYKLIKIQGELLKKL